MSTINNPYREGSQYHKLFAKAVSLNRENPKGFKKESLVNFAQKELKLSEKAALASVGVILSPRLTSIRTGDCRGNFSAMGHLYYIEVNETAISRFGKPVTNDKGEAETEVRYIVKMRETPMERFRRPKKEQETPQTTSEAVAAPAAEETAPVNAEAPAATE